MRQLTLTLTKDAADAAKYWEGKEYKKWAVDVTAGPLKRPTHCRTHYARARDRPLKEMHLARFIFKLLNLKDKYLFCWQNYFQKI